MALRALRFCRRGSFGYDIRDGAEQTRARPLSGSNAVQFVRLHVACPKARYPPPMRLTVNGRSRHLDVAPDATLLSVLRDHLHLTGAKPACERGECGACTVLVNGPDGVPDPIYSCLALAHAHDGDSITTIEGLASASAAHPVQTAFIEQDAVQCGFCTPGQVLAAVALLSRDRDPSDDDI